MKNKILLFIISLISLFSYNLTSPREYSPKVALSKPTAFNKIGSFLLGAAMAGNSEYLTAQLASSSIAGNTLKRLVLRLTCATASTLLLQTLPNEETFFNNWGIGYNSVVIASILRSLYKTAYIQRDSLTALLLEYVIEGGTLLSCIKDIYERLPSKHSRNEVTVQAIVTPTMMNDKTPLLSSL